MDGQTGGQAEACPTSGSSPTPSVGWASSLSGPSASALHSKTTNPAMTMWCSSSAHLHPPAPRRMWDGAGSQPVHGRAAAALRAADGLRTRPTFGGENARESVAHVEPAHLAAAAML